MQKRGVHCGSTSLADALRARGLELPEPVVFGLGAGCGFSLHSGDTALTPPQAGRFFVGRSGTFERDLCRTTGATIDEQIFLDADEAWPYIAGLLEKGEQPLVYTDLFHLPYTGARGHWFGHTVVVAGRAGDTVILADNEVSDLQRVSVADFKRALCTMLPVRLGSDVTVVRIGGSPRAPADPKPAVLGNALQMLDNADLESLPQELESWGARSDWQRCLRLAAQSIEVRGTGGGLFRRLYAEFLDDALPQVALLARASADAFAELARACDEARALEKPQLAECIDRAQASVEAEKRLWERARELCE